MIKTTSLRDARLAARAADARLGEDILVLDVRAETSVADCFLFVSATSHVHVRALEDAVREAVREGGSSLLRTDGVRGGTWRVLDYGGLIVHVMERQARAFYSVERLWERGKSLTWALTPSRAPKRTRRPARKKKPASPAKKKRKR